MLVVEPMRNADAVPVARLAAQNLSESYSPEWLSENAAPARTCLVARDVPTDKVVGFAVAASEACEGHLLALAVDQRYRGVGIGSALLRNVGRELTRSGAMRLKLEVRAEDQATQGFYLRHGFAPEGLEEHVYSDGGDAVRMARPL
ncbi:MAG TPA: GNAT family N-acetyltransferase [Candidatus Thermoplasmatota archaeon]|nr:GNAT family N-acetyltransferase [Candidatus Thermoplasmatota archaeon]